MRTSLHNKSKNARDLVDMDPFSVSIIEDLLQGHTEWKGVDDIVKLTFRALTDVIKAQSQSLHQIKTTLPTRASKAQLTTGLSLKANISDVTRTITEISNVLETKISLAEFHSVLKDYSTKHDVQQVLVGKASVEDLKHFFKHTSSVSDRGGPSSSDRHLELSGMQARLDELNKKMSGFVTIQQMQEVLAILDQKASVAEINEALESKVSKQALTTSLQKKLSKGQLESYISKKADISDLEYIVNSLETKVDLSTIEKLTQVIEKKCDKTDINILLAGLAEKSDKAEIELVIQATEEMKNRLEKQIKQLNPAAEFQKMKKRIDNLADSLTLAAKDVALRLTVNDVSPMLSNLRYELIEETNRIKAQTKSLHEQILVKSKQQFESRATLLKQLSEETRNWKKKQDKIYEQIDEVRRRAEEVAAKSVDRKDWIQFKSQIVTSLEEKLESEQIQLAFNKWHMDINKKLKEDKDQMLSVLNSVQKSVLGRLGSVNNEIADVVSMVGRKQDRQEVQSLEDSYKKLRRDMDQCRKAVDKVYGQLQNKLTLSEYQTDLAEIKKKLDLQLRQISTKANIKDVCVLVDSKPSTDMINKAIKQLQEEIDSKVSETQLKSVITDQASINQALCSQNIVARWLWLSGQVRTGSLVPWESQSVNTLPDNFLWDKDKTNILALASGMYEITACFFCKSKPVISILVNAEVVFTKAVAMPTEEGGIKKRRQKEMVGCKVVEYLMLPSRARVSISFTGEHGAEGFLNIKRL